MLAQAIDPATGYAGGEGTEESPYQIANAAQFVYFRNQVNAGNDADKHFKLTSDIDISDESPWTPIGVYNSTPANAKPFSGVFDGGGHTISGLNCNGTGAQGLFGYMLGAAGGKDKDGTPAVIQNLIVKGSVTNTASSTSYTGGVVGYGKFVKLVNVGNEAEITSSYGNVGGVIGYATIDTTNGGNIVISGCYNKGNITCTYTGNATASYFGGIAGYVSYGKKVYTGSSVDYGSYVTSCYNTGIVSTSGTATSGSTKITKSAGGLLGVAYINANGSLTVERSFNTGTASATSGYGGIVGQLNATAVNTTTFSQCYDVSEAPLGSSIALPSNANASDCATIKESCAKKSGNELNNDYVTLLGDGSTSAFRAGTTTPILSWEADSSTPPESKTSTITYMNITNADWVNGEGVSSYEEGASRALPTSTAVSRDGYVFLGWYETDGTQDNIEWGSPVTEIASTETGNKTFYARWIAESDAATVTYVYDNGTDPTEVKVAKDEAITEPTAPTKDGYVFEGWYVANETDTTYATGMTRYKFANTVSKDLRLVAHWDTPITLQLKDYPDKAKITLTDLATQDTIEGSTGSNIIHFTNLFKSHSYKASGTAEHYTKKEETYNLSGETGPTVQKSFIMDRISHTITYENLQGATAPTTTSYQEGYATVTLSAPTSIPTGYTFQGWYERNGTSGGDWGNQVSEIGTDATTDITVNAKWSVALDEAGFSISCDPTFGYTGSALTIPVTVSKGSKKAGNLVKLTDNTDYTYTITKTGDETTADVKDNVVDKGDYTIAVTGIGGYTGSLTASFEVVDFFTLYVQSGADGTPVAKKVFSKTEFEALAATGEHDPLAALYRGTSTAAWDVLIAKDYVTLDAVLDAAGVASSWKSGAKLAYGSASKPTTVSYDDLQTWNKFFPAAAGTESPACTAETSPLVFATSMVGKTTDNANSAGSYVNQVKGGTLAATASGAPRLMFGISDEGYAGTDTKFTAGQRLWSSINSLTLIIADKDVIDITGGTVTKNFDDSYGYTGNPISLSNITVQLADGKTKVDLSADDYDVVFYDAEGAQLGSAPSAKGDYTATVTGKGAYTGSITKSFKIAPYLTVYTQEGRAGEKVAKKAYENRAALEALVPTGEQDVVSAIYNGTNVITTTKYIPIESLLTDAGVLDSWKSNGSILNYGSRQYQPTYQSTQDTPTYFYPSATTDSYNVDSSSNKAASPLVLALLDNVGAIGKNGSTAGDVVNAIKSSVDAENTPRMVVGTTKADAAARSGATYAGNRIWRGVNEIVVITVADLTGTAEISGVEDKTYDGSGQEQDGLVVTYKGATLTKGTDYTVSYANNTNAGKATVTVTGTGTYKGSVSKDFTIAPISLKSAKVTTDPASYAYDGKAKEPAVTVTLDGKTLVKGTDYTVAYAKNTDPGTATVTVTGKGNYADSATGTFTINVTEATVNVQTHVQNIGWQKTVTDGGIAGTEGKGLRMEALKLTLPSDLPYKGGISYSAHVQNIGWQGAVADGKVAGTEGKALRVEAIRVELTGELADHYDVYYQVHAQNYGWLGWAKNGASAGTEGKALRLEALRVKLVAKGEAAPGSTDGAFVTSSGQVTSGTPASEQLVSYATHVQNVGWQVSNGDGGIAGTTGQSLRMEAVTLKLGDDIDGGIRYKAHIQNKGWESGWTADGKPSGTSGEALRLEAIQVELTGAAADNYDVYYRVHCQNIGWMGWAKNGESAGSEGYAYRLEALQVKLVPKGAAAPKADPASATNAAFQKK